MNKSPFSQQIAHFDFLLILFFEIKINIFQNVLHVCFTVFTIQVHVFVIWKKHYLFRIDVFQNVLPVCFTVIAIHIHVFIIWKKHYLFLIRLENWCCRWNIFCCFVFVLKILISYNPHHHILPVSNNLAQVWITWYLA